MGILENMRLALNSLRVNKVRSLLTMLGIIIGIASVIGILTIGNAMTHSVNDSLSSLGSKNIYVMLSPKNSGEYYDLDEEDKFTMEQVDLLEHQLQGKISGISLRENVGQGKVKDGRLYANAALMGVNPSAESIMNIKMKSGRFLSEKDLSENTNVAVVSDKLVNNMFNGSIKNALGSDISFYYKEDIYTFKIIGVYKYEEVNFGPGSGQQGNEKDYVTNVYIPLSTAQGITDSNVYSDFQVSAANEKLVETVQKDIKNFFKPIYRNNVKWKIHVESVQSATEQVNEVLSKIKLAIAVIAGISLLVGGIGVMNIMLVSVTERTREIGIRKALGATNNNIRTQFIIESVIVCLIGGFIGILLGGGMGYLASILLKAPSLPSISAIIVAVSFSMAIGVFFGYYPANRAAKLDPIDALRYE